eukprot:COSAG01_NODE_7618_length_3125_cov_1.828817_1_plen_97_part_00
MGSRSSDQASLQTKLEGSSDRVSDAAGNSMQMLRSKVAKGWKQIRASFRDSDPQKRGWVTAAELRAILGAAAVASFLAAVLTEIHLCDVCSCQETC